jgi:hypothetical protein
MSLTEEQQIELIRISQQTNENVRRVTELLASGEKRLKTNAELLRQSTEDIDMLLAFIKSKGLQPPKLQSSPGHSRHVPTITKAEGFFNRYTSCGALDEVLVKAFSEAERITVSGRPINWPEDWPQEPPATESGAEILVCFEDDSVFYVKHVPSPLSKNVKVTWGTLSRGQAFLEHSNMN